MIEQLVMLRQTCGSLYPGPSSQMRLLRQQTAQPLR